MQALSPIECNGNADYVLSESKNGDFLKIRRRLAFLCKKTSDHKQEIFRHESRPCCCRKPGYGG
jgi:hypothetical protein